MHMAQLQDGFGVADHDVLGWLRGFALLLILGLSPAAQAAERWLVLGDSLSAAYGIPQDAGWVALLGQRLSGLDSPIELINASLSGETTSGGLQRLPALLQEHRPTLVVLELGANDALRGQNLQATERNLRRMVELCQAQGARVVLLGIRLPTNYGPAYDRLLQKVYADTAAAYDLAFDPFFLEEVALKPELMQEDGLHPAAKAQPLILERVWQRIQAKPH
jgi:acyl-CoA thioesterase-1